MAADTATIIITIEPTVTAVDDTATTQAGQAVTVPVLANDLVNGAPATVAELDGPPTVVAIRPEGAGTATVDPETGDVEFTPAEGFCGSVEIDYEIERTCEPEACVEVTLTTEGVPTILTGGVVGDLPGFVWGETEQIDLTDPEEQGPMQFVYDSGADGYVMFNDFSIDCVTEQSGWQAQVPDFAARCAILTHNCG